jgi:hypothetical protein
MYQLKYENVLFQDGFTPADRIKQGMKVEVQDKMDPHRLWVATVGFAGIIFLNYV